jgi:hypothetical protein
LRLPARKLYRCRLHFSSACLVRMYCSTIEDQTAFELFHAHFNALFYGALHNVVVLVSALQKQRMWPTSKWELSLDEDLKTKLLKKKDLISSKINSIGLNWFQESNMFHQFCINFYQTHTCISLLLAFKKPLATSVTVNVIAQKITDTAQVKPQWAKIFEVGRYTF